LHLRFASLSLLCNLIYTVQSVLRMFVMNEWRWNTWEVFNIKDCKISYTKILPYLKVHNVLL